MERSYAKWVKGRQSAGRRGFFHGIFTGTKVVGYLLRVALPCVDLVQETFFVNWLPFCADPCLFERNGCATNRAQVYNIEC